MRDGNRLQRKNAVFNEEIAAGQAACQLGGDHEYLTDARACLKQALLFCAASVFFQVLDAMMTRERAAFLL